MSDERGKVNLENDIKEILDETIDTIQGQTYTDIWQKCRNIRCEWDYLYDDVEESDNCLAAIQYFLEEIINTSLAGAAACVNYLELQSGQNKSFTAEAGRIVFERIKFLYHDSQKQWENINVQQLLEVLLAMLYCYRYDTEVDAYLSKYLEKLSATYKDILRKVLCAWLQENSRENDGQDAIFLENDKEVGIRLLVDLKDLWEDEPLSQLQRAYLWKMDFASEASEEAFWEYVQYIRLNCPKTMQRLLFEVDFYQYLCRKLGTAEEAEQFVLSAKHPERYLYSFYEKITENQVEAEKLAAWREHIYLKNKAVLPEAGQIWGEWFYELKNILIHLEENAEEEVVFWNWLENRIQLLPAYKYEEIDYIKKLAAVLSDVFAQIFARKWECRKLCDILGENNLFLYSKDSFFKGWIGELQGVLEFTLYKEATDNFEAKYMANQPAEILWLYMNTNLRFVYDIRKFLTFLSGRLGDMECFNNENFWKYKKQHPIDTMHDDLGKKVNYISNADAFRIECAKDKGILSVFQKKYLEFLFYDYEIPATIRLIYPANRARDKVLLTFQKLCTGLTLDKTVRNSESAYCDEQWTQEHLEEIFTWGFSDCKCKICGFDSAKKRVYVNDVTEVEQVRELDKAAELRKLLEWMRQIRESENRIVYDPYYLWGKDADMYKSLVDEHGNMPTGMKVQQGWLFPCEPLEELKVEFAHAIFDTMYVLEGESKKLVDFLRQLNRGAMDAINEYRYIHGASNNAGTYIWNGEENGVSLKFYDELKETAKDDLRKLCEADGFSLEEKSNIYMNSYLKQYVPFEEFWQQIKTQCFREQVYFQDFFKSMEARKKDSNAFYFCLSYVDYQPGEGALFQLYPANELSEEYKWVYKFWNPKRDKRTLLNEKDRCWGSVYRVDDRNKTIYLGDIRTREGLKDYWHDFNKKLRDLHKSKTDEQIENLARNIRNILNAVDNKERFYSHEDRLTEVTRQLCKDFRNYNYNVRKMKLALEIFEGGNPYIIMACSDKHDKFKEAEERLRRSSDKDVYEECFATFCEKFYPKNVEMGVVFEVYYQMFYGLCGAEREKELFAKLEKQYQYSLNDIKSKADEIKGRLLKK